MDSIKATLTGKFLGIPIWIWGIALVAVGALYLRQRSQSQASSTGVQQAAGISDTGGQNVVPAYVANFPGTPTGIDYNGVNYYPYGTLLPPGTGSPTTGAPTPPSSTPPTCPSGSHPVSVPMGADSLGTGSTATGTIFQASGWICVADTPAPAPTTPAPTPAPAAPPLPAPPAPAPAPAPPPPPAAQYVTVGKWPGANSSLSDIAARAGVSLQQVENLNQWIYQQRHTWNLIYPGERVRVR